MQGGIRTTDSRLKLKISPPQLHHLALQVHDDAREFGDAHFRIGEGGADETFGFPDFDDICNVDGVVGISGVVDVQAKGFAFVELVVHPFIEETLGGGHENRTMSVRQDFQIFNGSFTLLQAGLFQHSFRDIGS